MPGMVHPCAGCTASADPTQDNKMPPHISGAAFDMYQALLDSVQRRTPRLQRDVSVLAATGRGLR